MFLSFNAEVQIALNNRDSGLSLLNIPVSFFMTAKKTEQEKFYLIEMMRKSDKDLKLECDFLASVEIAQSDFSARFERSISAKFEDFGVFMQAYLASLATNPATYVQCNCIGDSCSTHFKGSEWDLIIDMRLSKGIELTTFLGKTIQQLRVHQDKLSDELIAAKTEKKTASDDKIREDVRHYDMKYDELKQQLEGKLGDTVAKLKKEIDDLSKTNANLNDQLAKATKEKPQEKSSFEVAPMAADVEELKNRIKQLETEVQREKTKKEDIDTKPEAEIPPQKPSDTGDFGTQFAPKETTDPGFGQEFSSTDAFGSTTGFGNDQSFQGRGRGGGGRGRGAQGGGDFGDNRCGGDFGDNRRGGDFGDNRRGGARMEERRGGGGPRGGRIYGGGPRGGRRDEGGFEASDAFRGGSRGRGARDYGDRVPENTGTLPPGRGRRTFSGLSNFNAPEEPENAATSMIPQPNSRDWHDTPAAKQEEKPSDGGHNTSAADGMW